MNANFPENLKLTNWTTFRQREHIGEIARTKFGEEYEKVRMLEENLFLKNFSFLKGSKLLELSRFEKFQDIRNDLIPYSKDNRMIFVSHRWQSLNHPDPNCYSLSLLKKFIDQNALYWIDYSCLPQEPMTKIEAQLLQESLDNLASLFFSVEMIILRSIEDDYYQRAWCFFEALAAYLIVDKFSFVGSSGLENDGGIQVNSLIEDTIVNFKLPQILKATKVKDIKLIDNQVFIMVKFFYLSAISHYMILGQEISKDRYFYLEDRYTFFAGWNFSNVVLWTIKKAKELNLNLYEMKTNEFTDNFYMKMAQCYDFTEDSDPRFFSKGASIDQSKYAWLLLHHKKPLDKHLSSAHNLFYKITSLINK